MGAAKNRKHRQLIEQTRIRAHSMRNGVYVPRVEGDVKTARWPTCARCMTDVDAVNVEDVGKDRVTIRAHCHNEEAVLVLEFPFSIARREDTETWRHVTTAINACTFFESSLSL